MLETIQIGKLAPNFITIGIYKNRLGKIRLSDYYNVKLTQDIRKTDNLPWKIICFSALN